MPFTHSIYSSFIFYNKVSSNYILLYHHSTLCIYISFFLSSTHSVIYCTQWLLGVFLYTENPCYSLGVNVHTVRHDFTYWWGLDAIKHRRIKLDINVWWHAVKHHYTVTTTQVKIIIQVQVLHMKKCHPVYSEGGKGTWIHSMQKWESVQ